MTNIQNPFTNPQLLHPDLAAQITNAAEWQAHDPAAAVGAVGLAAAVQDAAKKLSDRGEVDGVSPEFSQTISSARNNLVSLITDIQIGLASDVPELTSSEFASTDWPRLEAGFQAYEQLGLQPEIVITPTGQKLEYWQTVFNHLYRWQEQSTLNPHNSRRLQFDADHSGLSISADIEEQWNVIVPAEPGWQVSVIVGTQNPNIRDVDRAGKDHDGNIPSSLQDILEKQPAHPDDATNTLDTYPTIEEYLMLQAAQFHQGRNPLDDTATTWLDGKAYIVGGFPVYPVGRVWCDDSEGCRVGIDWQGPDDFDTSSGVRPIIRG